MEHGAASYLFVEEELARGGCRDLLGKVNTGARAVINGHKQISVNAKNMKMCRL